MGNLKIDHKELDKLSEKLGQLINGQETDKFFENCAKELAARLLALVIPDTPVGVYPKKSGKKGGTLRRGWTGDTTQNAKEFAESIDVKKSGRTYIITIENNVKYAPYVEFGHRTRGGKGLVKGRHMLENSEQKLVSTAPDILQKKLDAFLKEAFNG